MAESVYKVVELVGASTKGWEDAVKAAVKQAAKSLRDIRNVTVQELDANVEGDEILYYRARVRLSFKYEP